MVGLAILATVAACGAPGPASTGPRGSDPAATATIAPTSPRLPTPTPSAPPPTAAPATVTPASRRAGVDEPPAAILTAEGGDPVLGQLGSYAWADGGSDSPWLQGAPITVGAVEPLAMAVDPAVPIASWSARMMPAGAGAPVGAVSLGQGSGSPRFEAPGPGDWTVEVQVRFADGLGSAAYFWALTST
jgi:hypothetical protein